MVGNDYQFVLSQAGKQLASDRFQISQYAGACPVALKDYHAATKRQAARINIDRRALRAAFSDLVVPDRLLDQLGPALISQNSIFLYGPSGNGKTSIAERMLRVYQDAVLIPYAVEIDNQILSLYDPVVHHRLELDDPEIRSALGALQAALHCGGRRTDPVDAGTPVGRVFRHLCRAAANEGEQRHLHH